MLKQILSECDRLGIEITERTERGKHHKLYLRNKQGTTMAFVASKSCSDFRGWSNCRALLRRFSRGAS